MRGNGWRLVQIVEVLGSELNVVITPALHPLVAGSFQTACRDGESVLAMCTDSQNKRLVCGDTAGYIAVYDIRNYCTASNKVLLTT